jgi:hypothetical protein
MRVARAYSVRLCVCVCVKEVHGGKGVRVLQGVQGVRGVCVCEAPACGCVCSVVCVCVCEAPACVRVSCVSVCACVEQVHGVHLE